MAVVAKAADWLLSLINLTAVNFVLALAALAKNDKTYGLPWVTNGPISTAALGEPPLTSSECPPTVKASLEFLTVVPPKPDQP